MPLDARDVERHLRRKFGFSRAATHSVDHHWYELEIPGLPTILTKVSHSEREIPDSLLTAMARQVRVRRPFFVGMIQCTHSKADYVKQVKTDPVPLFDL